MIAEAIKKLRNKENLPQTEILEIFERVVDGQVAEPDLCNFLQLLSEKGETVEEIAGAARALRGRCLPFLRPEYLFADCCGTGGDGAQTVNISTAVAFVAAQAGLPVAKHGNVSSAGATGSADLLRACGVRLEVPPACARACLDEIGLCFLFAPQYHAGLRFARAARKTLKMRTIFNLLGPLINPSQPPTQLIGVGSKRFVEPLARALTFLGAQQALVVHGDGLDECAIHGNTHMAQVRANAPIAFFDASPADLGVSQHPLAALRSGSPDANARWLSQLLRGEGEVAHVESVAANTAALLFASGTTEDFPSGAHLAREILRSGRAFEKLQTLREMTNGFAANNCT